MGAGGGTKKIIEAKKDKDGMDLGSFERGETTAADALALASQDKDAARFLASLGLSNLDKTAANNVGKGKNAQETFVEF